MSIIANYHRCLNCGNIWSFNPDIGRFRCPKCGSMRMGPALGPMPPVHAARLLDSVFGERERAAKQQER